jgi:hypothetical protein
MFWHFEKILSSMVEDCDPMRMALVCCGLNLKGVGPSMLASLPLLSPDITYCSLRSTVLSSPSFPAPFLPWETLFAPGYPAAAAPFQKLSGSNIFIHSSISA